MHVITCHIFTVCNMMYLIRTLRKLFKIDAADYMLAICGNEALRELSSPGKSGSFFYLTQDDRYMIKTMKKAEVKVSCLSYDAHETNAITFLMKNFSGSIFMPYLGPPKDALGIL